MWVILLILVIIFELVADVFSKQWSLAPKLYFLIGGVIFYLAANIFWLFSLRDGAGLARGVSIFSISCTIIAIIIGAVFYKESLSGTQTLGIILGIIALLLIFWKDIFR
jgi:multidrug transporter EmrE-like cation transporter